MQLFEGAVTRLLWCLQREWPYRYCCIVRILKKTTFCENKSIASRQHPLPAKFCLGICTDTACSYLPAPLHQLTQKGLLPPLVSLSLSLSVTNGEAVSMSNEFQQWPHQTWASWNMPILQEASDTFVLREYCFFSSKFSCTDFGMMFILLQYLQYLSSTYFLVKKVEEHQNFCDRYITKR